MADPRLKQITIKTGVLKRLCKEESVYKKEAEQQKVRVEKYKAAEPQDEYMIKKQEEVLQECLMMIPDCQRRLKKAFEDINELLKNEAELQETKEYIAATEIIDSAKALLA